MKTIALFFCFLFSLTTFSQNSKKAIENFGHFEFGMNKKQLQNAIKKHKTGITKVQTLPTNIIIDYIELDGLIYDNCVLGVNKGLDIAIFRKHYNSARGAEKGFERVVNSLIEKYGETFIDEDWSATWSDSEYRVILLQIEEDGEGNLSVVLSYINNFN